jgi:D-3-phosphoglycerate dehydrogenase
MPDQLKRVFYFKYLAHDVYLDVFRRRADVRLERLDPGTAPDAAAAVMASAHAYQVGAARDEIPVPFHVGRELLAKAPNLLIVSSNGAGYDTVDVAACTAAGVLVLNQSGGNAHSVAEHVLGMMLALSKRIVETDRAIRRGGASERAKFTGTEVRGKTIGIIGLGNVGRRVAQLCRGILEMQVLAYDPYVAAADMAARGVRKVDLETLCAEADFVSVNCPLTQETRGMIDARAFARMRPGAIFISTARGFIHDERALEAALRGKAIAGAGLDVWATEPPPADHPLLAFENVFVSPHTAGVTREARLTMGRIAAEQLIGALDGKRPPRIVNPQAWPAYARRFEAAFGFAPGAAEPAPA